MRVPITLEEATLNASCVAFARRDNGIVVIRNKLCPAIVSGKMQTQEGKRQSLSRDKIVNKPLHASIIFESRSEIWQTSN